jgi:hypothetical protein
MSDTRPEDMQKCTLCDALVDPAFLGDVWFHFVDGGCVSGGERSATLDAIRGEKVTPDA